MEIAHCILMTRARYVKTSILIFSFDSKTSTSSPSAFLPFTVAFKHGSCAYLFLEASNGKHVNMFHCRKLWFRYSVVPTFCVYSILANTPLIKRRTLSWCRLHYFV